MALALALTAISAPAHFSDIIVYNRSPSLPVGFYARTDAPVVRGAIVTVRAIDVAPQYARLRHFTKEGDRFIKRVVALSGARICVDRDMIFINGELAARRSARDSEGRPLPTWTGCHVLRGDEVLLLGDTPDSFDGRYWGPTPISAIESVWSPLAFGSSPRETLVSSQRARLRREAAP